MNGIRKEYGYPVLKIDSKNIVIDKEKAEILAKTCSKIHSSRNINEDGRKR